MSNLQDALAKEIVLSYAPADREIAGQLSSILIDWFGKSTWFRDFDLDGGQLIANALDEAIGEARWFVLLLSASSTSSAWVIHEANLATFRAIEEEAFRILVLQLDKQIDIPPALSAALRIATIVTPDEGEEIEGTFIRIAELIEQTGDTRDHAEVYVDRGSDADRFALTARRNRIVFIVGLSGVGKTAFCRNSVITKLRKRPLVLRITRGHSADLLAREVLMKCHVAAPNNDAVTDEELTNAALDAVALRAPKFFLLLDNVEDATDANNSLLSYLETFLQLFIKRGIDTHIVLGTTRQPDYSVAVGSAADVLRLGEIEDVYIREGLDLWLEGTPQHAKLVNSPEFGQLVTLASGFPLAAKLIASQLKADKAPSQLLTSGQRKRLELKFAAHILQTADKDLSDLERLVFYVLATVREPISVTDLWALPIVQKTSLEAVQRSVSRLSDLFLVQQTGELLSLHRFLQVHFEEQLAKEPSLRKDIAVQFGRYAYGQAIETNAVLDRELTHEPTRTSDERKVQLASTILRYAVPAGRLLRSVGDEALAERLPIRIQGTIREMVFFFYQEERDYRKALQYANRWLKVSPDDAEVLLYKARSLRNLRGGDYLLQAMHILEQLEARGGSRYYQARILREKGIVAEYLGNLTEAQEFFEEGIALAPERYPDNHVALAQLLLRESVEWPEYEDEYAPIDRAISLLEEAREKSATFDRLYLGRYIEALVRGGRLDEALPLVAQSLQEQPNDSRLHYRLGELYRKAGDLTIAEEHALAAVRNGSPRAFLTLANIHAAHGIAAIDEKNPENARQQFQQSRQILANFRPESDHDAELADNIRAKTFRLEGRWDEAERVLEPYAESKNPYTVYEQCKIQLHHASGSLKEGRKLDAAQRLGWVESKLKLLRQTRGLSAPLEDLLLETRQLLDRAK